MNFALLLSAIGLCGNVVKAQGSFYDWHPAGYGDVRAPCPMLNSLANHGFLPHDGKDITLEKTKHALSTALNISEDLSEHLFNFAITTNPTPNATFFSLEDLGNHNVLEHDASLSRADYYFGHDSVTFNETVFNETRSYWEGPIINVQMAANARLARVITSNTTNPEFFLSHTGSGFSVGETAAYIIILGDRDSGTVRKEVVEYLFENERLPVELGWKTASPVVLHSDLDAMEDRITNATGVSPEAARKMRARGDLHMGRNKMSEDIVS